MRKYDLLRNSETIIRILEIQPDRVLILDCIKRIMPVWVKPATLEPFDVCSVEDIGTDLPAIEALNADQRKVMVERYTVIAPILPFLANGKMRSELIHSIAIEHRISKQTIRNYL